MPQHLVTIDNYDEFKSGTVDSENLSVPDLLSLYNSIRNDGVKFGLNGDRHKYATKFSSIEEALKKTQAVYSSTVAAHESYLAVQAEETREEINENGHDNSSISGAVSSGSDSSVSIPILSQANNRTIPEHPRTPKVKTNLSKEAMASIPHDAIITVLATENPKRRSAALRFDLYRTGMTVKEYIDKVGHAQGLGDLLWDSDRKWISWN